MVSVVLLLAANLVEWWCDMALDPRLALETKTPGVVANLQPGLRLGAQIADMPRQAREAKRQEKANIRTDKQNQLMQIYAAWGDEPVTEMNIANFGVAMEEAGFPVDGMTLENAQRAVQMGKNLMAAKMQTSANKNRVVNTAELGGGAMQITYADGRTEVVTPTDEQRKAIEIAQQQQIAYEGDLNKARGKGRAGGAFEAEAEASDVLAEARGKIKEAEAAEAAKGKARGESEVKYRSLKSSLPALQTVVAQLRNLSNEATYTLPGKAYDAVMINMFGHTPKGATASAKYGSLVSNQVLPLLKQTLGAAFTAAEYEKLEATMGNDSYSPEQKQEQLDAFIQNKLLELQSLESEIQMSKPADQKDSANLSDDELLDMY